MSEQNEKDRNKARVAQCRVGILGMALSGSAAALLAQRLSGTPFVSDSAAESKLKDRCEQLKRQGIEFETGGHSDRLLDSDFVIVSPGVSTESEIVQKIRQKGIPLFSELEFGSWFVSGKMIAITGSNGKSTTVMMVQAIMEADNRSSVVCGNIGVPLTQVALDVPRDGVAVVEVSSYQLEFIDTFAPEVAVILNITPDHLERHKTLQEYREMKLNITRSQRADSSLVLNLSATSGGDLNPLAIHTAASKSYFGQIEELDSGSIAESQRAAFTRGTSVMANVSGTAIKLFEAVELPVPGEHNIENALAAASVALALGVGPDSIRRGLLAFKGVEHRLEFVVEIDGVRFVNDSKATNIAATRKALEAVDSPVHLIIGGRGKGEDFVTLLPVLSGRALSAVSIGETREEIFSALGRDIPVEFADSMEEAVSKSSKRAKSGETVLLSPACASFDMYQNFEMRGLDFKNIVMTLARRRQEEKVEG